MGQPTSGLLLAPDRQALPGYRLIEPLSRGGFSEVWKCEAPGGLFKAIKFVRGSGRINDSDAAEMEMRSLQQIKSIRHPFLLSVERVERLDSDLVIVMELADRSLHDLLEEHRAAGRPGVPRAELLGYLREAAEVLDLMNQEHGVLHLDIKPHNLFLVGKHIKVGDFGLVGFITPLYAAPERFQNRVTLFTDQYSLAASYMELVCGKLPFTGESIGQLMMQVTTGEPDLTALNECDRAIVARALRKEPRERFESCQAFIEALVAGGRFSSGR